MQLYIFTHISAVDGKGWDEVRECENERVGEGGWDGLLQSVKTITKN